MRLLLFLLPTLHLMAMLIGNPSQPALQKEGIFKTPPTWWSVRLAYLQDYVYRQKFSDEFPNSAFPHSRTISKLSTDAAQVTLNFRNRIDLYGIFGGSQIQIDREVFTSRQFSWGTGIKSIILHSGRLRIGADLKYFETDQQPLYFISENLPFNVRSNLTLNYYEVQAALGASLRTGPLVPYAYATYIFTKIAPQPPTVLVRHPMMELDVDIVMKSIVNQRHWGLALGATLVDAKRGSLAIEGRFFNQNSVDVNVEVRF